MPDNPSANRSRLLQAALLLAGIVPVGAATAQQTPATQPVPVRDYYVGNPGVGLPVAPPPADQASSGAAFAPASSTVRMFGALYSVESCAYDGRRGVIVAPSRGAPPAVRENDAWIALINHDGSVHTPRWIGVQNPGPERSNMSPPLVLNEPFGSLVHIGVLYLADRDGGVPDPQRPGQLTPGLAVIRTFDMDSGKPLRSIPVPGSRGLNDLAVARDGTIYGTNTGAPDDPESWVIWKIGTDSQSSIFVKGAPLFRPNGIEMDAQGNIVVVNMGNPDVITFTPDGRIAKKEQAMQAGSDGLVIMADGTKFVSSVQYGGISMIPPSGPAKLIAENIPNAASMCYDSDAHQLVVPMNSNNGLAFVPLKGIWQAAPRR